MLLIHFNKRDKNGAEALLINGDVWMDTIAGTVDMDELIYENYTKLYLEMFFHGIT